MTNQNVEQWSFKKFWADFNDSDQDLVYLAIDGLLTYIKSVDSFNEFGENGEVVLNTMINQILSDKRYLTDKSLKDIFDSLMFLIPQFSAKLPLDLVPVLYDAIFTNLSKDKINFFSILSNVVDNTISAAGSYNSERQHVIANYMMKKLIPIVNDENAKQNMKIYSLKLIALTVKTLPICITHEMNSDLKNLIENQLPKLNDENGAESNELKNSIDSVSKAYSSLPKVLN